MCPIRHRSSQEEGRGLTFTFPVHSNGPSVYTPEELLSIVLPKLRRVIGRMFLSVITPAYNYILIIFFMYKRTINKLPYVMTVLTAII